MKPQRVLPCIPHEFFKSLFVFLHTVNSLWPKQLTTREKKHPILWALTVPDSCYIYPVSPSCYSLTLSFSCHCINNSSNPDTYYFTIISWDWQLKVIFVKYILKFVEDQLFPGFCGTIFVNIKITWKAVISKIVWYYICKHFLKLLEDQMFCFSTYL